jgi:hypothetical protein
MMKKNRKWVSGKFEATIVNITRVDESWWDEDYGTVHGAYWIYFDDPKESIAILEMSPKLLPKIGDKMEMEYKDDGSVILYWPFGKGTLHSWRIMNVDSDPHIVL